MTIFAQLILGSVLLGICALLHVSFLVGAAMLLARIGHRFAHLQHGLHTGLLIVGGTTALIVAHTVEVWIWALSLILLGAVHNFSEAVYFALVTYTTVGYGDVVLGPEFRVFGAMAAVTGLLTFGLSTAFLVAILARLFPNARPY